MFHCSSLHYAVEAVHTFGTNVVGFQLAMGDWLCYIVRCHLAPDYTLKIESVVSVLKDLPQGAKLLVAVDLNINLSEL